MFFMAVEKSQFSTTALWTKKQAVSKANAGFPHIFLLLLLLLPKNIYFYIFYSIFQKRGFVHAFYL